ncbi:hypothetical protein, partial [Acidocella aminolytica]|uniref:hypothetical protein n=1 Tax=Acidocella aminolytica TaxID=33998 RepID=UPI0019D717AE
CPWCSGWDKPAGLARGAKIYPKSPQTPRLKQHALFSVPTLTSHDMGDFIGSLNSQRRAAKISGLHLDGLIGYKPHG